MTLAEKIIVMWQCGFNTAEIGKVVDLPEFRVLEIVHAWREASPAPDRFHDRALPRAAR